MNNKNIFVLIFILFLIVISYSVDILNTKKLEAEKETLAQILKPFKVRNSRMRS